MVIIQGTFRVAPGERDAFVAQSAETMKVVRTEPGCLEYVMAADPLEPDRVVLSERWATRDDLDEHVRALGRRHQEAAERGDPPGVAPSSRTVVIYEVASSEPMG
jgi:quinol monooxygenase YgiN